MSDPSPKGGRFLRRDKIARRIAVGTGIALLATGLFLSGMVVEQRRLWPWKFFITAETLLFHKDFTETNYRDKVSIWKDIEITQPVVMLGDSIVEFGDWPELLNAGPVSNRGIAKDTTEGVLARVDFSSGRNGKVFLMIGTNDLGQRVPEALILERYRKIIIALNSRNNMVYAHSILFNIDNEKLNETIDGLNSSIKAICSEMEKCKYIDLNMALRDKKHLSSKYTYDGIHPNAAGYRVWSDVIRPYVR